MSAIIAFFPALCKSFFSQGNLCPSHYQFWWKYVIQAQGQIFFFLHFQVQKLDPVISQQCNGVICSMQTKRFMIDLWIWCSLERVGGGRRLLLHMDKVHYDQKKRCFLGH